MKKQETRAFAPATVANVACGFDTLGFALDGVGDEIVVRRSKEKGLKITKIDGARLPLDPSQNVSTVAMQSLLDELGCEEGFEVEIYKGISPGSGIGSSAASAAGAVVALNDLLENPFSRQQLVHHGMQGEALASGAAHADNVAPSILGGFTLVRSYTPLDVIEVPTPELYAVIVHPDIEIKTSDARKILKKKVLLTEAIQQWGNVGALVTGLCTSDYNLISRSLEDHIVEPIRSMLIPYYSNVKQASQEAGALGGGISGSGPSIFTLSKDQKTSESVAQAIDDIYKGSGLEYKIYTSKINLKGSYILD